MRVVGFFYDYLGEQTVKDLGIDFILDSLGEKVKDDLSLHIDGLKTHIDSLKPINKAQLLTTDL